MTRALRVLLRQQFDPHLVPARTEVPRQDAGFEEGLSAPGHNAIAVTALRLAGVFIVIRANRFVRVCLPGLQDCQHRGTGE